MSSVRFIPQVLEIVVLARFLKDFPHRCRIEVAAGSLVDFEGRSVDGAGNGVAGSHGGEDDFDVARGADCEFGDVRMNVPGEVAKHCVAGAFGDDLVAYGLRWRSRFGRFGPLCEGFGQSYEGSGIGFFVGFSSFSGYLIE